jgi:7-carboxy-7-deazaguanine synthase
MPLVVNEIFGPTIQGEGPNLGRRCGFVRLGGCNLECSWCDSILEGTPIRLAGGGWIPIERIRPGTKILGVDVNTPRSQDQVAPQHRYVVAEATHLVSHWDDSAFELIFDDGSKLVCTGNHQIFVRRRQGKYGNRNWIWVAAEDLRIGSDEFWSLGVPTLYETSPDYVEGWLAGYTVGDGHLTKRGGTEWDTISTDIYARTQQYLEEVGISHGHHIRTAPSGSVVYRSYASSWQPHQGHSPEWKRGWVAGFYDAEGSDNGTLPTFSQKTLGPLEICAGYLKEFGFESRISSMQISSGCHTLTVRGGTVERFRFDDVFGYAKSRKSKVAPDSIMKRRTRLVDKTKLKGAYKFFDIGSTSGNFFANGTLVHNTPYTWDWTGKNGVVYDPKTELHPMSIDDVAKAVDAMQVSMLVVSGGEPLQQQDAIYALAIHMRRYYTLGTMEIETNGTIVPGKRLADLDYVRFNVSPKLSNSGNHISKREKVDAFRFFTTHPQSVFKFVCRNAEDLNEVGILQKMYYIPSGKIYIMPEGTSQEAILEHTRQISEEVLERQWNLTTRLHVLMYGNRRAV